MILGIDEAGRGPWAGPLVVGAVVLGGAQIEGLTDSKKLSKKRREALELEILDKAEAYGLGWVTAEELDEIGMSAALVLATKRAVEQIKVPYHEIIIDGTINFLKDTTKGEYVTTMPKADLLVPSVSAASILAKVARDRYMTEQDGVYPGYKFGSHAGYGTAAHRAAIEKLGVTPLHRLSFAPLQKYAYPDWPEEINVSTTCGGMSPPTSTQIGNGAETAATELKTPARHSELDSESNRNKPTRETTRKIGDKGEDAATNHLVRLGHDIIERNWKTKYCEIDIISRCGDVLYFTEVKYRKQPRQGGGLAAITAKKLNQMKFAANYYVQAKQVKGVDLRLAVISATGDPADVEEYIELN